jgi:ribosomal protein S18
MRAYYILATAHGFNRENIREYDYRATDMLRTSVTDFGRVDSSGVKIRGYCLLF